MQAECELAKLGERLLDLLSRPADPGDRFVARARVRLRLAKDAFEAEQPAFSAFVQALLEPLTLGVA